ncbi:MAG: 2'-deoxycytidine 5'-triphosphate deaminase [bacterium]|nr:2'-deoxycytidine 5'-triphosphate deaminase [bacterium]
MINRPGVLSKSQLKELVEKGVIKNGYKNACGGSSYNLHLGSTGWHLEHGGFKGKTDKKIETLVHSAIKNGSIGIVPLPIPPSGLKLLPKNTYLFKIKEQIDLSSEQDLYGQGTGRSSIGRLDVLTRLLIDNEEKYDYLSCGSLKNLYLEITPFSFPIIVFKNYPIYQLRFCKGNFHQLQIQTELLKFYSVMLKDQTGKNPISDEKQTHLRLNLEPTSITGIGKDIIAFEAKGGNGVEPLKLREGLKHPPEAYWKPIFLSEAVTISGKKAILVKTNKFYILRSQERFILPDDIAVYGVAMTEEIGELRIHYAGFVHPGFGNKRPDNKGTPLIFEVRGHDVGMYLMEGDLMAELRYYPMSNRSNVPSDYDDQELKLSSVFTEFKK